MQATMMHTGSAATAPRQFAGSSRPFTRTAIRRSAPRSVLQTKAAADSEKYFAERLDTVAQHFPTSLGVDDFVARTEVALHAYGFDGSNTIACSNLCRDEVTIVLKEKLDAVFGSAFNSNGLGGVLTCGVIGIGAGLSHAPIPASGKERYVFFSFPHIAIDSAGKIGNISRPGRPGESKACGALVGALGALQGNGVDGCCGKENEHDPENPEFSILLHRLAEQCKEESVDAKSLDLVKMTAIAERRITKDLEKLISKSVDGKKADYAVVTGVQIHNWGTDVNKGDEPSLEFVAPSSVYVVVDGKRSEVDLSLIPALTPRQITLLNSAENAHNNGGPADVAGSANSVTTLRAIDVPAAWSAAAHSK